MIKLLSKYPHNTARRQIAKSLWDFGVGRAQLFGKKCYLLEYQNKIHLGSEKSQLKFTEARCII